MNLRSITRTQWRWAAAYLGLWVVLAVGSAASAYFAQLLWDKPLPWTIALGRSFKEWLTFGFLALGILWLCGRVPLAAGQVRRWALSHLGASLVFSPLYVAVLSGLMAGERSVQDGSILTFSGLFQKLIVSYFVWNLMMYWMVVLAHLGWRSYQDYRERERRATVLGTELLEAKLQALRMQLNPHFLFNTLNTISALIHDDPSMADRMVVRLGDLLRRTLEHRDAHEVPLRDELSFLRDYLAIEQARFGDRLTATIDVAPETESLYVPFLLLQPLVENAIRHGIEPREEPGHVTVTARRDGNQLELRVVDNGDGLADAAGAPPSEGIGLANTRTRLAYLYEDEHSLELRNGSRGGLEVRVRIPCRTAARPYQPRIKIIAGREASRPDGKCCPNHG